MPDLRAFFNLPAMNAEVSSQSSFALNTLLADALAADEGLLERLVQCHPAVERLRTPGFGRALSRMLNFADLAGLAGVDSEELLRVANGLRQPGPLRVVEVASADPAWLSAASSVETLDVRPLIAHGEDPFHVIMAKLEHLKEGAALCIEAPFDPIPLRRMLDGRGMLCHRHRLSDAHWRIFVAAPANPSVASAGKKLGEEIGAPKVWQDGEESHIDVRGLPPPQPLYAVLSLLEEISGQGPVILHHEREPLLLYPELEERGWKWRHIPGDSGEVRLELTRVEG
jgi:uncharacterized protein (DUF2249 family)